MSDNTTINPGAGGDTVRTIDRTTAKTQVVGLDFGGEPGIESIASQANPLPTQDNVLQGLMQQQLLILRACHMLLQHIAGITVNPSDLSDDGSFSN